MEEINYNDVVVAWEKGVDAVPTFDDAGHGVEFLIRPYPRKGTRGDAKERAIGVQWNEPFVGLPELPVRNAITGKAGEYGALALPYVIAVNSMSVQGREEHLLDAVFGSPAVQVSQTDQGSQFENVRRPDGAWFSAGGPQNTRVSAVIFTQRVDPWHIGLRRARLLLNPWATKPASFLDLGIDRWEVSPPKDELIESTGHSLAEIFELPRNWPE
jgi:hypothetical protein